MADISTIQQRIQQQDQLRAGIKELKQVLNDALMEDDQYQRVDLEMRELTAKKKRIKDEVWKQPDLESATAKIKEMQEELKDLGDILDTELLEWRQSHNTDEFPTADGGIRRVKISVRLQAKYESNAA